MSQKQTTINAPASSETNAVIKVDAPEYETLLAQVKKEYSLFVVKANKYVPQLADALEKTGMAVEQIRAKLYSDLAPYYAHGTITNALPSKYKDKIKAENARHRQSEPEILLTKNEREPIHRKTPENVDVKNYHSVYIRFMTGKNSEDKQFREIVLSAPHIVVTNRPHGYQGGRIEITYNEKEVHLPKSNYLAYNAPSPNSIGKIYGRSDAQA